MAITSMGGRDVEDDPTEELPVLSDAVPGALDPALVAQLPVLTEQWHGISDDLRVDLPLLTDALPEKEQAARVREALVAQQPPAPAAEQPVAPAATADELEQLAVLQDYVTGRKRWWHDMEREVESARLRIRELEFELEQRGARQMAAEARADRESARASRLRTQLANSARELRRLREQRLSPCRL